MSAGDENIHKGHRVRLKKQFSENGLGIFPDHSVIELLLFFSIPQGDVNPLAHRLLNKFGSLAAVFDAPLDELMKINGVGANTALLIKLIPQLTRRYLLSLGGTRQSLNSTKKAGEYLLPLYLGELTEVFYVVCLDTKCKVLNCKLLFRGTLNSANINVREIIKHTLLYNPASVIISHNHLSGVALPSDDDIWTTKRVKEALGTIDVALLDHIIVADGDFVSMADNGFLR